MRSLPLTLAAIAAFSHPSWAQTAEFPDRSQQMSACHAWHDRVANTVRQNSEIGLLRADEAVAVTGLVEIIGKRCTSDDPARMSQLFAIVLDTLSDQRNQP